MAKQKKEEISKSRSFNPFRKIWNFYLALKRENLLKFFLSVLILVLIGGSLVFIAEMKSNKEMFSHFFDSFWWALVTITTVGYEDRYPVTLLGRVFAIFIMLTGVVVISMLSGTIASIFVDRKIREGKGLYDINLRNHTVICGWNINSEKILTGLLHLEKGVKKAVVLVNEMDPEEFQALTVRHPNLDIKFVRGDFVNEKVLRRAGVDSTKSAIIISDRSLRI